MKTIERKQTNEYTLRNDALTDSNKDDIQEFVNIFQEGFGIDWDKDITVTVRTKHNEEGANIIVKVKDNDVEEVDVNQLKLFEADKKPSKN
jgi:hypothetical protein